MRFSHIFQKNLEIFDPLEEGAGVFLDPPMKHR